MADNTIDTLELEIKSSSEQAIKSLNNLSKKLLEVNKSLSSLNGSGLRKFAKDIGTLQNALQLFSGTKVKMPKIYGVTEEIDRMKSYISSESKKMSEEISKSFMIKGNSVKSITEQIKKIGESFSVDNFSEASKMIDILANDIIDATSNVKLMDDEMQSFYQTLLKIGKIKVSSNIPKSMPDEWKYMDGLLRQKVSTKEGTELDSLMNEWKNSYKGIFSGLNVDTVEDQFTALNSIIKQCREGITQPVDKGMLEEEVWKTLINHTEKFKTSIESAKKAFESTGGTTEKKNVGFSSIIRDIKRLSEIDTGNIENIGKSLSEFFSGASKISEIKFDSSSILKAFDTIKKIGSDSNIKKTQNLNAVAGNLKLLSQSMDSFNNLANIPDVSNSVNRFLSSIQKLANAGDKAKQVKASLPDLGNQLKKIAEQFSSLKDVSPSINMLVQSIGRIASAGNKTGQTSSQLKDLSKSILEFFNEMKNAPQISQNIIDLVKALAQLSSAGGGVNRATNAVSKSFSTLSSSGKMSNSILGMMEKTMGTVARNIAKLGNGISSSFRNITSSSNGLKTASFNLGTLLKTAIGFRAIQGVFNFGRNALDGRGILEIGSAVTEVQNVVDVAFGNMAGMVDEFAKTSIEKFGLSELAAKQYSGTMMAMLKSSGVLKDTAAEMSITLAGLAGDISSFYNIDADEAFSKIRSGIAGEIEPLRQLGISMTVANLEAFALSQGITKSYQAMTQAEQVMLRYNYLMWASSDAQGDFARTSGNWANQVRMLSMNFQHLTSIIGQGLIAAILPAIKALNSLMEKLIQAATAFRNFMYVLMGKKIEGSQSGIASMIPDLGGAESGLDGIGSAGDKASTGMDTASDSAKKLKKVLSVLPFDQLNQLTSNDASDISVPKPNKGDGDVSGNVGDLLGSDFGSISESIEDLMKQDTTPISKWAEKMRKAFLKEDWEGLGKTIADMLNSGLQKVYDVINWNKVEPKITKFTNAFTRTFNSFVDNFDWDLLGRTIGAGINTIVNTLNLLIEGINWKNLGKKFAEGIMGIVHEVNWKNLGNLLGNGFMISWNILYGLVTNLKFDEIGTALGTAVNGIFEKVDFETVGTVFAKGFNGIFEFLKNFTLTVEWDTVAEKIYTGLNAMFKKIDWPAAGESLNLLMTDLLNTIWIVVKNTNWEEFGEGIGNFLANIDWIGHLKKIGSIILETFGGIFDGLEASGTAGKVASWLFKAFALVKVFSSVMKLGSNIVSAITGENMYSKLFNAFTSVFGKSAKGASGSIEGLEKAIGSSSKATEMLGNSSIFTAGIMGHLAETLKHTKGMADATPYSALGTVLLGLKDSGEITNNKFNELYGTLSTARNKAVPFGDAMVYMEDELKEAGVSVNKFEKKMSSTLDEMGVKAPEKAKIIGSGIANGTAEGIEQSKKVVKDATEGLGGKLINWFKKILGIHSPSTVFAGLGKNVVDGLKNGINDRSGSALDTISKLGEKLRSSMDNHLKRISKSTDNTMDRVGSSFDSAIGNARDAAWSIANAFSNINIPLPHIDVYWDNFRVGDLSFSIPKFGLQWYEKGGLFSGASVIGVGEAGNEAVLPLENPRVMRMIAESIMSNAPRRGIAESEELTNAIAKGFAIAMMNNSGAERQTIVDTKLYLDGKQIARSVQKAQRDDDYRFNPVSQFA